MQNQQNETLAIIGVGQLADYFLAGLRKSGDNRRVLLSPHNRNNAETLAAKHRCDVAADNQSAVDAAQLVLLATRPENTPEALSGLSFRDDQVVISVAAGIGLDILEPLAAPATVARSLPVCSAEIGLGGMPLFPDNADANALLSKTGEVVVLDNESAFDAIAVTGCAIGWFFQIFAELQDWMVNNGIALEQARAMSLHSAHGASGLALAKPDIGLSELADSIARPGTFTLIGMDILREQGGLSSIHHACDDILRRFNDAKTH